MLKEEIEERSGKKKDKSIIKPKVSTMSRYANYNQEKDFSKNDLITFLEKRLEDYENKQQEA